MQSVSPWLLDCLDAGSLVVCLMPPSIDIHYSTWLLVDRLMHLLFPKALQLACTENIIGLLGFGSLGSCSSWSLSLFICYYYYLITLPSYTLRGTCTYPLNAICFKHSGHPTSSIPDIAAWLLLNAGVPHRLPRPDWYAWAVSVHTLPLLPKMLNTFPNAFTFTFFIYSLLINNNKDKEYVSIILIFLQLCLTFFTVGNRRLSTPVPSYWEIWFLSRDDLFCNHHLGIVKAHCTYAGSFDKATEVNLYSIKLFIKLLH